MKLGDMPSTLAERFWKFVTRGTPDECWEWQGNRRPNGYGRITSNAWEGFKPRKGLGAHRVSWELHYGEIPDGMVICHKCDNPPCVNPNHLFLGTVSDNLQDALQKGLVPLGDDHHNAVLTVDKVVRIRQMIIEGRTHRSIGAEFGVDPTTVSQIRRGKTWAHV